MTAPLASTILDTTRDSLKLHVGFCRWRDTLLPWHRAGYDGW